LRAETKEFTFDEDLIKENENNHLRMKTWWLKATGTDAKFVVLSALSMSFAVAQNVILSAAKDP